MASRTAAVRRGSRRPSTARVSPSYLPTAGVHAVAVVASSARTQKMRAASATSVTCSFTAASFVAAITYQVSSQVLVAEPSLDPGHLARDAPAPRSPA